LINELVKLGLSPSLASEAVRALWRREWDKSYGAGETKLYAVMWQSGGTWATALCAQKVCGGPMFDHARMKSGKIKMTSQMQLPKRAFAVIPISDIISHAPRLREGVQQ
jgi:hypothetical protein